MSTDMQPNSLDNQADAINRYADQHGFEIVRTFSDPGQSGLEIKRRPGLASLLQEVISGSGCYRAILVYDVSRWGRFQDNDEAAHYEFLCKSAGVPVHYCAETFANDGAMPSVIMKALKRAMAAEYSRELSAKSYEGKRRLASMGYHGGGIPGYGLRRMLLAPDGSRKQILNTGESKSLSTERVILVPGPKEEVGWVREMFRMVVEEKATVTSVMRMLNARGVKHFGGAWNYTTVWNTLRNPKYTGWNVWGCSTQKLRTRARPTPKESWIERPGSFEPIVAQATFDAAQKVLDGKTLHKTNEVLLEDLKRLWAEKGYLSGPLLDDTPGVPSVNAYRARFGGLRHAYNLIGYDSAVVEGFFRRNEVRQRTHRLRNEVISKLVELGGTRVYYPVVSGRQRARVKFKGSPSISVLILRTVRTQLGNLRWTINRVEKEKRLPTLLCRCTSTNDALLDYYLVPSVDRSPQFRIKENDPWLRRGRKITDLSKLPAMLRTFWGNMDSKRR